MKLRKFLENLNNMVAEDKSLLDFDVVTAIDDEGNGFKPVYYAPSTGKFDGQDFDSNKEANIKPNAICLN